MTLLEIECQVRKILQSDCLSGKTQMQTLLRLLMRNWESQNTLKPDRIALELWPESAAQKTSADIAAVVARLRRTLEQYYGIEGTEDHVLISMPDRSVRVNGNQREILWIAARLKTNEIPSSAHAIQAVTVTLEAPALLSSGTSVPGTAAAAALTSSSAEEVRSVKNLPSADTSISWKKVGMTLGLVLAFALAFAGGQWLYADSEPNAARLNGNTLQVLNSKGSVLWSKSFPGGFWPDLFDAAAAERVRFEDLGDGHKSVLLLYHQADRAKTNSSVLICYSHKGKELWRWHPGRVLPELKGDTGMYVLREIAVMRDGGKTRIVALSDHFPFYPAQIALIDAKGKTVSEYWHSGHLDSMLITDLDGDGRHEVVATGIANGYKQAVLVVLDAGKISGASEETGETRFQLHGLGVAQERFRILFPRSDLNMATTQYNYAGDITMANGILRVPVRECELNLYCMIWYGLDSKLGLRSVRLDDHFKDAHASYFHNTQPPHLLNEDYVKQFEKVRCLKGCSDEFVLNLTDAALLPAH